MAAVNGTTIGSENFSTIKTDPKPKEGSNSEKTIDVKSGNENNYDGVDINMNKSEKISEIQEFYNGKNILITGATGFLGKILMEKLLRCCPGVENLYLLVRQKRGKDIYTRIEEMFEDPVFDRLKEEVPKFRHKIVAIPADCEAAGLGLNITDRQTLIEKVHVIFHSAATVKFDEHLRAALITNVQAPLYLLELAKDMKGLKVFMHISTAYSNSHLTHVEEKFYPCKSESEKLHNMINKLTDAQINDILPIILDKWPNTYTFTKALAEKELRRNSKNVPLGIFRPAIVSSTAKEPLKCWLDNMYGPTGAAVGTVTGMLRTMQCDESVTADLVPVDSAVNCLMVAAHDVYKQFRDSSFIEPPIFNYVSSVENRITWGEFTNLNLAMIDKHPFSNAVWYVSLTLNKSALMHQIYMFFLHLIPAALVDGLALCIGKKPKMLKVYSKIHKFSSVLRYFCTREITFCNRRTRELWEKTSDLDKQIFPFSMSDVDWNDYFEDYLAGIRRYLFKDSDDTIPQARIKWKRLYYLHQIVRFLFLMFVIYALWSIFTRIF
ncbi:fatty acyl-CoA reductase wat-like [Vanessa cardui]|uniref:fatty acyl-CoA reductase wat-like n=1 Tax=Vanessa cardui TaxID=171605 RepID=UPI001F133C36|nr:fatty acyl-CoA reductase wat-like [Vanessa cardui]XP_046975947.1 fatty acyl-CoA reductase wat-like [Vanessa cardui]XP_046975948.1 fatty acyl-CoA reductase wat-like [Vanessa cardui]